MAKLSLSLFPNQVHLTSVLATTSLPPVLKQRKTFKKGRTGRSFKEPKRAEWPSFRRPLPQVPPPPKPGARDGSAQPVRPASRSLQAARANRRSQPAKQAAKEESGGGEAPAAVAATALVAASPPPSLPGGGSSLQPLCSALGHVTLT